MSAPEPALADFLQENGLAQPDEEGNWTPLTGGVSSDIWRVDTSVATFCVKRALAQLKVEAEWLADTSRNASEWDYMEQAGRLVPGSVPDLLVQDKDRGLFAMAWLDPAEYRLWKAELLAGHVDTLFAGAMGDLLGRIHAGSARNDDVMARFATDANFHALRIDPYILECARVHPDLADRLQALAQRTAQTKLALVHGDVSPKNILVGPSGPVLLDAEVAWYGDPAFDVAFCLNHLLLKALHVPDARTALLRAFDAFVEAYFRLVVWEDRQALEMRAATLLPALALARVDGKSPVEYLNGEEQAQLRRAAMEAIRQAPRTLREARDILT